jgi:hypothetical protein
MLANDNGLRTVVGRKANILNRFSIAAILAASCSTPPCHVSMQWISIGWTFPQTPMR